MNTRGEITSTPLGYNAHGQKVTLFAQRQGDGSMVHSIRVEPRTFREQPQLLEGLTTENLRAAADAIQEVRP